MILRNRSGSVQPMIKAISFPLLIVSFALVFGPYHAAESQLSERFQAMNQPAEPFRIAGNLYYVGANSVTSFLITTPEGHILIDGGFAETVPLIRSGVKELGFRFEDIALLLNSHAHFDHSGGLSKIREETGAQFFAHEREVPLLERGGLGDDLLGDEAPYQPIQVDRRLEDGDVVEWGGMELKAHLTAGHTRGCTSWAFDIVDGETTYHVVSICSLSVLEGMRFGSEPTYPDIQGDFERSFDTLESLPVDIFLASHADFFNLEEKLKRLESTSDSKGSPQPFVDPEGYLAYIAKARKRFEKAVAAEQAEP